MELIGGVARKRGKPENLAVEVAKTTCAARVAAHTGRFHVPPVVRFEADPGVLDTQRVHGFVSLMQLVASRDPRVSGICRRVGVAIAEVHAQMRLPEDLRIPLPAPLAGELADACALHGDLNGSNVGYDPSSDRVVIVDWSAAPALGVVATVGSPYFDLLWFALFFFRSRSAKELFGWSPERWAGAFLAGYASASPSFSADALRAYHERVRTFLYADYQVERERLGKGIRRIPYLVWQKLGWRRWEGFLAALSDPRVHAPDEGRPGA